MESLILCGSVLMSLGILKTIMDFKKIEKLDVYCVESLSRHELNKLIKHLPRLNYLTMEFNPLFIVFAFDEFREGEYLEFFIEKLSLHWLKHNSYRLAMNYFTYRGGDEYQHIQMSIGGPKTERYPKAYTFLD